MESALNGPYADMVREHFHEAGSAYGIINLSPLHGAVWSGGSFRLCT